MSNGARGTKREHRVAAWLRELGYVVYRSSGSHRPADLVVLKDGERPRLVQVKGTARSPFNDFGPADRVALVDEASQAGAAAQLCHWPPFAREPRFLGVDEWPDTPGIPKLKAAA